jgi:2-polyprenyl-3-methyl-5-hydroxy-6-metoxy-1,4-benzoquinol methylase
MIKQDPENNETQALFELVDFTDRNVLEIGCGDGRLTWRYAEHTAHVIAIDTFEESIVRALANRPETLTDKVDFRHQSLEDFGQANSPSEFDIVILAWSL